MVSPVAAECLTIMPQQALYDLDMERKFREEFGAKIFAELLNGMSVESLSNVLNSPETVAIPRRSAGLVSFIDLMNMRARIWRYSGAIWLASFSVEPELICMRQGMTEQPALEPSLREGMPDLFFGRPVFFTRFAPELGEQADLSCLNWSQCLRGNVQPRNRGPKFSPQVVLAA